MKAKKLKIYVADLVHDRHLYNYYVPLNVGYVAGTINKRFDKFVNTKIFKFPNDLIKTMNESPPDILALSNYDWNVNLNKAIIKIARQINHDVFVVMGGPNIKKKPDGIKKFLLNSPIDLYVVNEGEDAFSILIEYIIENWPCNIKQTIDSSGKKFPSVAYLQNDTKNLLLGPKPKSAYEKNINFPSPWLSGLMDPFLNNKKFPLQALVETNRNCPYQCHFCVWGDFDLTKIRIFDFDVVIEELRYIFKKAERRFTFMIADANVGILHRDVQIAEELRRLSDKYKNVDQVFFAQAKNSIGRNLEIAKILKNICIPEFAVQTLTPGVLENSGRKNLSNVAIKKYVDDIKSLGNEVYTDILLGLPGESKKEFYTSMQNVIDYGFQRAAVSDIRLLDGSVYAEEDYKKKYGIESLFRVIPSAYGEYGGIKVVEYEECIRKTNTMTKDDFKELRLFNAHYYILYFIELGKPLIDFAEKNGVRTIKLISEISTDVDKDKYPTLYNYLEQFHKQAGGEWYESEMDANKHYLKDEIFDELMKNGFPKLAYQYAAQLITNYDLKNEFLTWVAHNIKNKLSTKKLQVDEIANFCAKRVYNLPFENKIDTMELSPDTANYLTSYLDDYNFFYKSNKEKIGEYRDLIGGPSYSGDKKDDLNPSSNFVAHKNKISQIKFDTDKKKSLWLSKEIKKFGGDKDILLAIQLLLNVNQKAFLRSFSISGVDKPSHF